MRQFVLPPKARVYDFCRQVSLEDLHRRRFAFLMMRDDSNYLVIVIFSVDGRGVWRQWTVSTGIHANEPKGLQLLAAMKGYDNVGFPGKEHFESFSSTLTIPYKGNRQCHKQNVGSEPEPGNGEVAEADTVQSQTTLVECISQGKIYPGADGLLYVDVPGIYQGMLSARGGGSGGGDSGGNAASGGRSSSSPKEVEDPFSAMKRFGRPASAVKIEAHSLPSTIEGGFEQLTIAQAGSEPSEEKGEVWESDGSSNEPAEIYEPAPSTKDSDYDSRPFKVDTGGKKGSGVAPTKSQLKNRKKHQRKREKKKREAESGKTVKKSLEEQYIEVLGGTDPAPEMYRAFINHLIEKGRKFSSIEQEILALWRSGQIPEPVCLRLQSVLYDMFEQ